VDEVRHGRRRSRSGARASGLTHPRAYGTFTRILGRYVRDEGVLQLEDAVRKMTAPRSPRAYRSRIAGCCARACSPISSSSIRPPWPIRATFEAPHQLSVGVRDVLVNGVPVVSNGEHTGATPGRAIFGPGYAGRR
jgi:N-acyl-D-amino-acid deacylase